MPHRLLNHLKMSTTDLSPLRPNPQSQRVSGKEADGAKLHRVEEQPLQWSLFTGNVMYLTKGKIRKKIGCVINGQLQLLGQGYSQRGRVHT